MTGTRRSVHSQTHNSRAWENRSSSCGKLVRTGRVHLVRTIAHDSTLSKVGQLNRLAAAPGLAPIYAGIISREQPYRREVATAVSTCLQTIIERRA